MPNPGMPCAVNEMVSWQDFRRPRFSPYGLCLAPLDPQESLQYCVATDVRFLGEQSWQLS